MSLKKSAPYLLTAVFAVGLLFFASKSIQYKKQLSQIQQQNEVNAQKVADFERLAEIDSLVLYGNYDEAIASYTASLNTAAENRMNIPLRIALTEKLRDKNTEDSPALNTQATETDSMPETNWSEDIANRKYDSINFSLEKAKVQLARLKKQLKQKSFGEYLTFTSAKGNRMHYIGQVKDGKANGYGVALLDTGSRYEGQWVNNQRHGEGTFYWADGEYYVGNYKNDKRSGFGTYYWPNGEKYTGDWKNDKRSGIGKFYDSDGDVVAGGEWDDDELVKLNKK
ncbi:MORN repeat-containing protein [Flagellimonas sp. GZD32]|uniref:MORN repeat-containing protein n=1 Tax=Flagellimonas cixiensis TaxID=3228750 RepID=UPI0035C93BFF